MVFLKSAEKSKTQKRTMTVFTCDDGPWRGKKAQQISYDTKKRKPQSKKRRSLMGRSRRRRQFSLSLGEKSKGTKNTRTPGQKGERKMKGQDEEKTTCQGGKVLGRGPGLT